MKKTKCYTCGSVADIDKLEPGEHCPQCGSYVVVIEQRKDLPLSIEEVYHLMDSHNKVTLFVEVPINVYADKISVVLERFLSHKITGSYTHIEGLVSCPRHGEETSPGCRTWNGDVVLLEVTFDVSRWLERYRKARRRVVCAALRLEDGSIICGARHFDAIMHGQLAKHGKYDRSVVEQGFIDQFGVFMDRKEALQVALSKGQRIRRCGGDEEELWSENLY